MHYQRYRYRGVLDQVAPKPDACQQCGTPLVGTFSRRFCSRLCSDRHRAAIVAAATPRVNASCAQCGRDLSEVGKRRDAKFCSFKCGQDWRNARLAEATLRAKESRPACRGCGGPVDPAKPRTALYCSRECKIRSRRHEAYGLTREELDTLLRQHERCAICGTQTWGQKGPQVDHDHATGRVRGVLCASCNNGLGRFKDDPKILRAAARYLSG